MRPTSTSLALLLAGSLLTASVAFATPSDGTRGPGARRLSHRSRSTGFPWDGRLRRGVLLHESAHVRYTTEYRAAGNFWGTWELVQLLERAAYRVSRRLPGAKLSVGELSRERGGRIPGHASHRSGRDADLAFYMLDGRGRPFAPFAFAAFRGNGQGRGVNSGLRFDDARNWELVAKLVADGDARVQYIFVSNALKRRLLREGRRRHASASVLRRAEAVLIQPSGHNRHENHFHLRIYCPPASRPACRDRAPFHPWYPGRRPR
ncbi:MAG: penicillin-insensitive murein endopeptidase [Deltaproteobacteria bacterium]|nr:penicillin-insensitive murein endopeptidase [Deltaproteobacteria bacterium]